MFIEPTFQRSLRDFLAEFSLRQIRQRPTDQRVIASSRQAIEESRDLLQRVALDHPDIH